jgi:regulator of nonsense transcripts 2
MMRKMTATHLPGQERAMLQNAFYYCNPPDRPAILQKERTPMEMFIRKMIYLDLSKKTVSSVLKKLRMLHWEDPAIFSLLQKIFTKIWKLKYNNIYYLAQITASLMRYHPDFVIALVDSVFEYIRVGLEQNIFLHNQRRLAMVRYLGELYNFRVVETATIFDTLYLIVTFGYGMALAVAYIDGGRPRAGVLNSLDMPNDFFRVHLVCVLLDTCGQCFDRGSAKKKLDHFLAFFQV